ncbi:MAG: terpene cyclase/mutase family protein [Verrucomicrobia subdivision 3 bacterium]|nr:terpene cyclase/mutase family protein [Limisphaerales bacterium]
MSGNPGSRASFSPTVTRTPQTIPTFQVVKPNPQPALVANEPGAELAELPPLANPYELRLTPKLRADFVKRQGGGPETEAAVALALEWLKRNQSKNGYWNHRSSHTTAATGAAMLAFLGWGTKHNEPGPYQQTLSRAIDWMLSVEKNGDLRYRGNMYDHGIASIALMEAYNLTKDERLRAPAERILEFTLKAQNPTSGGWRYKPHREDPSEKGDLSISGWQMMILKSARLGGMKVPEEAFTKARKFLDGVGVEGKGFQYRPGWTPSSAMIAEGLFCEQMLSAGVKNAKMEQCLNLIQKQLPSNNRVDYYYWYYGSLAMRQAQGQDWQSWNDKLKPILLGKQIKRGNNRGAWEPEGKNATAAGRVVTTALAALSLEVYYRYLPLYSPELSKADN